MSQFSLSEMNRAISSSIFCALTPRSRPTTKPPFPPAKRSRRPRFWSDETTARAFAGLHDVVVGQTIATDIGLDWIGFPSKKFFVRRKTRGNLSRHKISRPKRETEEHVPNLSLSLSLFNDVANEPLFVVRGRAVVSFERDAEAARVCASSGNTTFQRLLSLSSSPPREKTKTK